MKDLKVRADKNCSECKMNMLMAEDLNIDYLFEDWRGCSEHCDECGEEGILEKCWSDKEDGSKEEWYQCLNCGKDFKLQRHGLKEK